MNLCLQALLIAVEQRPHYFADHKESDPRYKELKYKNASRLLYDLGIRPTVWVSYDILLTCRAFLDCWQRKQCPPVLRRNCHVPNQILTDNELAHQTCLNVGCDLIHNFSRNGPHLFHCKATQSEITGEEIFYWCSLSTCVAQQASCLGCAGPSWRICICHCNEQ